MGWRISEWREFAAAKSRCEAIHIAAAEQTAKAFRANEIKHSLSEFFSLIRRMLYEGNRNLKKLKKELQAKR